MSEDVEARAPLPPFVHLLAPGVSIGALGVIGFVFTAGLVSRVNMPGELRPVVAFLAGALLLPPLCAAIQIFIVRPDSRSPTARPAEMLICWAAIALLLALASFPLVMYVVGGGPQYWRHQARVIFGLMTTPPVLIAATVMLGIGLTGAIFIARRQLWAREVMASRSAQVVMFVLAFSLASFTLFRIAPSHPYLNFLVGLAFDPPFSAEPGAFGLGRAFTLAVLGIAAVAALVRLEAGLERRASPSLPAARTGALCGAVLVTVLCFFDFSLAHDTFHYLINVGPALHVLHGGTPMVDAFSQYGPGPIVATAVGFLIGPPTFGPPQLLVQLFNLASYALWLACFHRMSRWKLAGSLLGVFSIAFVFAAWGRGYGNVNDGPSILGFRYLPTLLMVLALSHLHRPKRFSAGTALSTFLAGLWSIETLVGTLGVHLAFLGFLGLRDRTVVRLAADTARALVPAAAALAVMTIATMLRAGTTPDFRTYQALVGATVASLPTSYNLAGAWDAVVDPTFFGWMAMWLAIFLMSSDAWGRVLDSATRVASLDDAIFFYRFVPMATLLLLQWTYFVARRIDFTLVLALLPFCAIAIPAALAFTNAVASARGPVRLLALIPVSIGLWVLTFTSLSLLREDTPYSLFVHECRDLGRCTPSAMVEGLHETLHGRAVLERLRRPLPDAWFDRDDIVRDALTMIEKWAGQEDRVTVLLGPLRGGLVATEIALMYAGKWHRWPRSLTFTDEFLPSLAQRIIAAPVHLREGELVVIRRDESLLGVIETGILRRIRTEDSLCRLPHPSKELDAYRVAGPGGCPTE